MEMRSVTKVKGKEQQFGQVGVVGEPEQQLSNYYQPSEGQRKYEYLFIVLGMGLSFYLFSQFHT